MLNPKDVLNDLDARLRAAFPGEVADVVLFGSQAKGTATEDSDYDFVLVWKGGMVPWEKRKAIRELCYDISLKYFIITQSLIISEEELSGLRGLQPIYQDAMKYGARAA